MFSTVMCVFVCVCLRPHQFSLLCINGVAELQQSLKLVVLGERYDLHHGPKLTEDLEGRKQGHHEDMSKLDPRREGGLSGLYFSTVDIGEKDSWDKDRERNSKSNSLGPHSNPGLCINLIG